MGNAKVSILVAVYNAVATLDRCISSLIGQTYRNVEFICVDDASTDTSLSLLQSYARRDERVRIIHRNENGGAACARNEALKEAMGEYIMFVDSDDYIAEDAVEQVVTAFRESDDTDCVLLRLMLVEDGRETDYPMSPFETMTGEEAFRASLTWKIHGVYAVRGDIHRRYPYDESCRAFSDDNTTRVHYLKSRTVRSCSGRYFYVQHAGSVSHAVDIRQIDMLRANESMRRQLISLGVEENIVRGYEEVRWRTLIGTYMFYYKHRRRLTAAERRLALAEMRRVYYTIDTESVPRRLRWKFGYAPLKPFWALFRMEEELYFLFRSAKERFI